jgi:putative MATE family efflux protein
MENENRYLGEEKISKLLIKFSIPCVMALLISALYNIVDQIFIGNSELGFLGNAATGVSFPIICIANAFAWCVGDGAASYLSICSGRKDTESAHKCVGSGIVVTLIISFILMIICEAFAAPLMTLFGASVQTIDMAVKYFQIVSAAFPIYLLLNVMNSMIRADGSPKYAMIAMLVGALTNIALDPIFIFGFKWGIAGAAWATVIGQVGSFVMCAVYFFKPKSFVLTKKSFIIDKNILRNTIALGASTFVTQISIAVLSLVSNMALAKYGELSIYGKDIPISVFSIQTKVYTVVCSIVTGIVLGGQPIFGYNYGAKKFDRVKQTYKVVLISTLIIGIVATLIFQLSPQIIINIFGSGDALYQEFATKTFKIYLSLMTITCLVKMTAVFFQSIGKSIRAVIASLIRDILCFTPLVLVLSNVFEKNNTGSGINGILYAAPIADFVSIFVILILTFTFFKNLSKTEEIEEVVVETIKESKPGLIITITREHGSKGKYIGKLVAEKLNIPFYYKEMIAIAASESGLDKEFISNMNNDAPNVLYDLYLSTDAVKQSIIAQEKIIRKIADNGACVIVGRASDYILRDYDNVIKIFIHAPKEFRINNIMEMYNDDIQSATENVKKSDYARSLYYRNISGKKWNDPKNYTLCIDSSIGIDLAVEQIYNLYNMMNK